MDEGFDHSRQMFSLIVKSLESVDRRFEQVDHRLENLEKIKENT